MSLRARPLRTRALLALVVLTSSCGRASLQYVRWRADGTPDFGEPVPDGVVAPVPTTAGP